ncbi:MULTISPECIES: exodeoxyribonuclease III [Gordonia]|uniref:Exodeoxyribonuclease III n=2 Tax=Gordonia TaxID=2053 RepID=L7LGQ8_9ACTN|nr:MULTISPECIES: exodeoxyribonuclease III [Gordonia]AUH69917.1 exodeoxyribonuclease III [Gordonia sp. YC-JH1]MBY4569967.1 exodeoxyribonuclease III [Gordonia sihwensis]WFN93416.1 exodeoxyribonuclease III [Gordonia sihwensis]GAC59282.1 exodeoxyribonuclease III [Gordonia sihwensis NBRC 108236]
MRVATWNVNSVRQRVPRLLPWLDERSPDVVCLQETKVTDEAFAAELGDELAARGYEFAHAGQGQWNGVALLSRVGLDDVRIAFPGAPGFPDPESAPEGRAVSAVCDGVRVYSVYVPNGREVGSDHYAYKLAWLAKLREAVEPEADSTVVCGDYNIIPTDDDCFDPAAFVGHTHVTDAERAAFEALKGAGLHDVMREHWPSERIYTYWDYRAGMFHKDLGMRIDFLLAGGPVAARAQACWVDRKARKGTKPSDHAPVFLDLDTAPDGDVGPVVPPPSRPAQVKPGSVKLPHSVAD